MTRREIKDDGICILTFDRPESGANIFDAATLRDLSEQLDFLEKEASLKGVILISAKKSIFVAGADLASELARDKQEINFVLENFENSCNIPQLSPKGLEDIERPLIFEIQIKDSFISSSFFDTSNSDRGPPALI